MKQASMNGSSIHIVRIENMVGIGTLDTNLCYAGRETWLEGKHLIRLPVKDTTPVKIGFRDEQRTFAIRRLLAGGITYAWCHVELDSKSRKDRGWYLIPLTSVDLIDRVKEGMPLFEFLGYRNLSASELANNLVQQLYTLSL